MGAITQAMARACEAVGVEISLESPVAKVLVDGGKVRGVKLESGEEIAAPLVAANVGPKLLYDRLVDPADLPADFRRRIKAFKWFCKYLGVEPGPERTLSCKGERLRGYITQ